MTNEWATCADSVVWLQT